MSDTTTEPGTGHDDSALSDAEARQLGVLLSRRVSAPGRIRARGTAPTAARPRVPWSAAHTAYAFYGVAATGAVIGQTWVALDRLHWSEAVPVFVRVLAVLPFAVCLELLAMALAAMADERMRLGERAYGFRVFSGVVAGVAVGIQVGGHWPDFYWSSVFGLLSASAYLLWLLHSAARRRDALRAAGKLADTAPDYGLWRRVRHPIWTARAAELAREGRTDPHTGTWQPLGLFESLRAAELALGDEKRRPAVARAVEQVVRADHRDPRLAEVTVRTLDLDRLAAELAARIDYTTWADRLAPAVTAPSPRHGGADVGSLAPAIVDTPTVLQPDPAERREPAAMPVPPSASVADSGDVDHQKLEPHAAPGPETDTDDEPDDEDDGLDLAPDLVPLLPAARAARDELTNNGRTVSRDALAFQLRRDGHAIRNDRVSELLKVLRREDTSVNGARPTIRT